MNWSRRCNGSLTLEAALIMPIFISFLLFLITMVRIALVDMAVHQTVNEASKQAAAHMYLTQLTYEQLQGTKVGEIIDDAAERKQRIDDELYRTKERLKNLEYVVHIFGDVLPDEIQEILAAPGQMEKNIVGLYNSALGRMVQPFVEHYADERVLDHNNLYVTKVVFPNLKELDQPYFGIEVRYDMPLHLPFMDHILSFKHQSYERVWIGDYYSNNLISSNPYLQEDQLDEEVEEEEDELLEKLVIHSISSPVQRGRKVRIIAHGPANETATIQLYYQSRFEKEKSCTSDAAGWFHCDIPIGGNSIEGNFVAMMSTAGAQDSGTFIVLSKANMKKRKGG